MAKKTDIIAEAITPVGEGGIGAVLLDGDGAFDLADALFRSPSKKSARTARPGELIYGHIIADGEALDEVILEAIPPAKSFSGREQVEIHCHGGIIPLNLILDKLEKLGAKVADDDEIEKRAASSGRITELDREVRAFLPACATRRQLDVVLRAAGGALARELRAAAALAGTGKGGEAAALLDGVIAGARVGVRLFSLPDVVVAGSRNVGKSSLFNRLVRENRAIVSDVPGTTRDAVTCRVNVMGIPVRLVDTAGIGEPSDGLDRAGMKISRKMIAGAGLVLFMVDGSAPLGEPDRIIAKKIANKDFIAIINKADLPVLTGEDEVRALLGEGRGARVMRISAKSGAGLAELDGAMEKALLGGDGGREPLCFTERQLGEVGKIHEAAGGASKGKDGVEELVENFLKH